MARAITIVCIGCDKPFDVDIGEKRISLPTRAGDNATAFIMANRYKKCPNCGKIWDLSPSPKAVKSITETIEQNRS